jgi:CheY-like chemotaxis protein/PAS domain-containing protein
VTTEPEPTGEQGTRQLADAVCKAMDLAPIGVAIVGLGGAILADNGTLRRWSGADRGEPGLPVALAPAGDIRRRLPRVVAGEAVSFETSRCELVPAVRGAFAVTMSPLQVEGRVVACSVFVTDEHQGSAEAPERPMHERFRDLVEGAADGIIFARGNVLLYGNRVVREWLGLSGPAYLVGELLTEVFDPHSQLGTSSQASGLVETSLRRADGGEVPVVVSVARVGLPEGATTVLVVRRRAAASRWESDASSRALATLEATLDVADATWSALQAGGGDPERDPAELGAHLSAAREICRALRTGFGGMPSAGRVEVLEEIAPDSRHQRSSRPSRGTILVCDDEVRLAMLTAGLLEQSGYEVVTEGDGGAAVRALAARPIDVVLLDLNLPDANARDVIATMRARSLARPVILTSGYAEEDVDPTLLRDPSVAAYLAKPYSVDRLVQTIERAMSHRP